MNKSKELQAFKKHFIENCSVRVFDTIEHRNYFHWKRLEFSTLNHDDIIEIAKYIRDTFSTDGSYTHLSPKLHAFNCNLVLTVDVDLIKSHIL